MLDVVAARGPGRSYPVSTVVPWLSDSAAQLRCSQPKGWGGAGTPACARRHAHVMNAAAMVDAATMPWLNLVGWVVLFAVNSLPNKQGELSDKYDTPITPPGVWAMQAP